MTDAFIAEVVSAGTEANTWTVTPQITEHDGTLHPDITVGVVEGITPHAGEKVLILTTRNNLDNSAIHRYYEASEACGRIVAVVQTSTEFELTGDFKFVGDMTVDGNLHVTGDLTVDGNATISGDADFDGADKTVTCSNDLQVDGDLTVNGTFMNGSVNMTTHTHSTSSPGAPTGPPQ